MFGLVHGVWFYEHWTTRQLPSKLIPRNNRTQPFSQKLLCLPTTGKASLFAHLGKHEIFTPIKTYPPITVRQLACSQIPSPRPILFKHLQFGNPSQLSPWCARLGAPEKAPHIQRLSLSRETSVGAPNPSFANLKLEFHREDKGLTGEVALLASHQVLKFHFHAAFSDLMEEPSRTDGEMPAKPAQGLYKRIYILSDADFALTIRGFTDAPNWQD